MPSRRSSSDRVVVPVRLWLLAGSLSVGIGIVTILRHLYFLTADYDMGFYVHSVWRIGQGEWTNSISGVHVFGDHFSPIMVLLAPVSYLDTAIGLLVIQAVAVGTAIIPAYRLGRRLGGDSLGWLCALWLGLSASVWHTVMYDFRPATLGFVALVWLIAELETERRTWLVLVLLGLAAASREEVAVFAGLAVLMHTYLVRDRGLVAPGAASIGVGAWYAIMGQQFFAPFDYFLWYRYADYGGGPIDALGNIGYALPTAVERLARPEVLVAFGALLIPFLLIPPFLGWRRTWPAFLIMIGNGISGVPFIPTIYYQYYILAVVFLLWGSAHILATGWWLRRSSAVAYLTIGVFLAAGPIVTYASTPFGRSIADVAALAPRAVLWEEIDQLPEGDSISAGTSLLPHLAERHEIYSYPQPMTCGEVLQLYTPKTHFPDWVVIRSQDQTELDLVELGYEVVDDQGLVAIWKSSGTHPDSTTCPSAEYLRFALYERILESAGRG